MRAEAPVLIGDQRLDEERGRHRRASTGKPPAAVGDREGPQQRAVAVERRAVPVGGSQIAAAVSARRPQRGGRERRCRRRTSDCDGERHRRCGRPRAQSSRSVRGRGALRHDPPCTPSAAGRRPRRGPSPCGARRSGRYMSSTSAAGWAKRAGRDGAHDVGELERASGRSPSGRARRRSGRRGTPHAPAARRGSSQSRLATSPLSRRCGLSISKPAGSGSSTTRRAPKGSGGRHGEHGDEARALLDRGEVDRLALQRVVAARSMV